MFVADVRNDKNKDDQRWSNYILIAIFHAYSIKSHKPCIMRYLTLRGDVRWKYTDLQLKQGQFY